MKLEILLSCMHQTDDTLLHRSHITGDVLMINQCDLNLEYTGKTQHGTARIVSTTTRGLTKSRNMAIAVSDADVCLLCDDDESFVADYEKRILHAYRTVPEADLIIFKMCNQPTPFRDQIRELRFPWIMSVSSWQISFRRESLLRTGVRFDELLGAGTGNGAEEELKFLMDCRKAGLKIIYVPTQIASVWQTESTWFDGFTKQFFINRGATTRYILGLIPAFLYAIYYVIKNRTKYRKYLTPLQAFCALLHGMRENKVTKQRKALDRKQKGSKG
jgi:glycosyltransferase involved in cell wall biosynthesis